MPILRKPRLLFKCFGAFKPAVSPARVCGRYMSPSLTALQAVLTSANRSTYPPLLQLAVPTESFVLFTLHTIDEPEWGLSYTFDSFVRKASNVIERMTPTSVSPSGAPVTLEVYAPVQPFLHKKTAPSHLGATTTYKTAPYLRQPPILRMQKSSTVESSLV